MKKVLILGCGWVGEDLVGKMMSLGYEIWATTTKEDKATRLKELGVHAVVLSFDNDPVLGLLPEEFDYVLTSVPAASKLELPQVNVRFKTIHQLLKTLKFKKHIYLSSTGIYPDVDGVFTESFANPLNERLLLAENIMLTLPNTIVYRLGGLFGKNRVFAKYFENKPCTSGEQIANFVHVDDVVNLLYNGFIADLTFTVYNIVSPIHPLKKEVIIASAEKYNFQLPIAWNPTDTFQKFVDGTRIVDELNYTFKFPNPINF